MAGLAAPKKLYNERLDRRCAAVHSARWEVRMKMYRDLYTGAPVLLFDKGADRFVSIPNKMKGLQQEVFDITDICKDYFEKPYACIEDIMRKPYVLMPPFKQQFFYCRMPPVWRLGDGTQLPNPLPSEIGIHVWRAYGDVGRKKIPASILHTPEEARVQLMCSIFVRGEHGEIYSPGVTMRWLTDLGHEIDVEPGKQMCLLGAWPEADNDRLIHFVNLLESPLLIALAFLNCKNVGSKKHVVPAKLNRSFQRKHRLPYYSYRTLVVKGTSLGCGQQPAIGESGIVQPLHLCRGHFKHFEGKGLFGKLKGTFWWEAHVRGAKEIGTVEKDYRIQPS